MKKYKDLDNNSDIEAYEYDDTQFIIHFKDASERIDEQLTSFEMNNLRRFADSGRGLDEYIKELDTRK